MQIWLMLELSRACCLGMPWQNVKPNNILRLRDNSQSRSFLYAIGIDAYSATERSHITNRYIYDTSDRLILVDNYIDDKMVSSEYLIYQDNTIFGITIGMSGRVISISEEQYSNERIECYICAFYSGEEYRMRCYQMDYEKYYYDEYGLLDWDYYQIHYGWEDIAPSGFINHNRYRFTREDGELKSLTMVNGDGTPINGGFSAEIKIKRKA